MINLILLNPMGGGAENKVPSKTPIFYFLEQPSRKYEPRREKTGLRGFRPGATQTGLYSHRR